MVLLRFTEKKTHCLYTGDLMLNSFMSDIFETPNESINYLLKIQELDDKLNMHYSVRFQICIAICSMTRRLQNLKSQMRRL